MEIIRSHKKNTKIYSKINYLKLLLIFVIAFLLFSLFFYYIGNQQNLDRSVITALIIALLLSVGTIIGDLAENRTRVFILDKDIVGFIEIHKDNLGGNYLKEQYYLDTINKYGVEEIYNNNENYEGIDKGEIKEIIYLKKKYNRIVMKVKVDVKEWKSSSSFFISKLYMIDTEKTKKMIIPNDYDNYEKLYRKIKKTNKI